MKKLGEPTDAPLGVHARRINAPTFLGKTPGTLTLDAALQNDIAAIALQELRHLYRNTVSQAAVVVIDALASRRMSRVCTTVQLSDSGVVPGSGVGNHRSALNRKTLGVPVIALGVPTVVDAATIAADLLGNSSEEEAERLRKSAAPMMVTPRDIDHSVRQLGKVAGYAINRALQDMDISEMTALLT